MNWLLEPKYSYLGIILFLFLTGCGLPVPEEVAIFTAGKLAADGHILTPLALASCIFGCLLGDSVMYFIGRRFGRRLLQRHSLWAQIITPEREEQIETQIKEHGVKVFFAARFLVGVRGPVYLTAGILKVPYPRFLLIDFLAASLVNGIFFTLSYFFGKPVFDWIQKSEWGLTVVAILTAVGLVAWLWFHYRHKHAEKLRAAAAHAQHTTKSPVDQPEEVSVPDDPL